MWKRLLLLLALLVLWGSLNAHRPRLCAAAEQALTGLSLRLWGVCETAGTNTAACLGRWWESVTSAG